MKQRIGVGSALLIVLVTCIVLAAVSSATYAAAGGPAAGLSVKQVTVIDPFSLRSVTVSSAQSRDMLKPFSSVLNTSALRSIRIPYRPPRRSAFQPAW